MSNKVKPTKPTKTKRVNADFHIIKEPISDDEKIELFDAAHLKYREAAALEIERANRNKEFQAQIKEAETEGYQLSTMAHEGFRRVNAECEQILDYEKGIFQLRRLDTGEVVQERPMNDAEKQMQLDNDAA